MLSVYVCLDVITMVAQIVTAAHKRFVVLHAQTY